VILAGSARIKIAIVTEEASAIRRQLDDSAVPLGVGVEAGCADATGPAAAKMAGR
jgi:hypothetical protein